MIIVMMKIKKAKICDAKTRGFPNPAEGLIKWSCLDAEFFHLFLEIWFKHFYIYSASKTDLQFWQGKNTLCYYLADYIRIDFEFVMERATNKISTKY